MPESLSEIIKKNKEIIEIMAFFWFVSYVFIYVTYSLFGYVIGAIAAMLLYATRHPAVLADERIKKMFRFLKDRQPDKHINKYINALVAIYCAFLLVSLISNGVYLVPEQMLFFGLIGAVYLGKGKKFIRDWLPLVLLILAYEAMRGIAGSVGPWVHYAELINADKALFGVVPTVYLQERFFIPGSVMWYDLLAAMVYIMHFSAPLIVAYFFWCEGKEYLFRHMSATILITTYSALIFFLLYPAAPPWLASTYGYLPKVHKVLFMVSEAWGLRVLWTVYGYINPNPVAAIPSLHAAFPWIVYLYINKRWSEKKISHLAIIFPLAMALSIVYLGEHYVIDVVAGVILASAAYLFVDFIYMRKQKETERRNGH